MEIVSHSLVETADFAFKILTDLVKKKPKNQKATVVALQGDLGSGKTAFTQAVARALGINERVTSPTFVIIKSYAIPKEWQGESLPVGKDSPWLWGKLIHIDCYRLEGANDLLHLGWAELAADPDNLILVEWPERVGSLLSFPSFKIKFEVAGETSRKVIYG